MNMKNTSETNKNSSNYFSPEPTLSLDDQKWISENTPFSDDREQKSSELKIDTVNVNRSVIGSCKRQENPKETTNKHQAIAKLLKCNYRTPPVVIASYLEIIFGRWEANPGIWLTVAQFHHPKTINSVIYQMIKAHRRGDKKFIEPARYFVVTVKKKPNRRSLKHTNGGYKQQKQKGEIL
jgi:hypothetical protein